MAPIIEGVAKLRNSGQRLDTARIRLEPNVAAALFQRLNVVTSYEANVASTIAEFFGKDYRAGRTLVGEINPVVEAIHGTIHRVLRISKREPSQDNLAHIGTAIAVGVLKIEQVRGVCNQDAFSPAHHSSRQNQLVSEHGATVRAAIAVGVLEQAHAAHLACIQRIAAIFHDVDTTVLVYLHRNRRHNIRLGREQFDSKALLDAKVIDGGLGREWRTRAAACGKYDANSRDGGGTANPSHSD